MSIKSMFLVLGHTHIPFVSYLYCSLCYQNITYNFVFRHENGSFPNQYVSCMHCKFSTKCNHGLQSPCVELRMKYKQQQGPVWPADTTWHRQVSRKHSSTLTPCVYVFQLESADLWCGHLYGCLTWSLPTKEEHRLKVCVNECCEGCSDLRWRI